MICPYCLVNSAQLHQSDEDGVEGYRCPEESCGRLLPNDFVREYANYPPAIFSAVGLSGHGKTCFLYSLLYELGRAVDDWPDFSHSPLDERSMADVLDKLRDFALGNLPEPTNAAFPEPVILKIDGIPKVGSLQLYLYDNGGEIFIDLPRLRMFAPYLAKSPVIVWLLSLEDLSHPHELLQLLGVYRESMLGLKTDSKKQNLLVVLTKADGIRALRDTETTPASILSALGQDGYDPGGYTWAGLEGLSNDIERWMEKQADQANFVRRARRSFAEVRYCVASALGSTPTDRQLTTQISPRGVLATLYWLAWYQLPKVTLVVGDQRIKFLSIEQAIEAASEHEDARVELGEGTFPVTKTVRVRQSLRLVGKGLAATVIHFREASSLVVEQSERFRAEGITFQGSGEGGTNLVTVDVAKLDLKACRFTGATSTTSEPGGVRGGLGLRVRGSTVGSIRSCEFLDNSVSGLYLMDDASVQVESNVFEKNGVAGLWYAGRSSGTARKNRSAKNLQTGVIIRGEATPTLEANQLVGQTRFGVRVMDDAAPILEGNVCDNNGVGISFSGRSSGWAWDNQLTANRQAGFEVLEQANPIRTRPGEEADAQTPAQPNLADPSPPRAEPNSIPEEFGWDVPVSGPSPTKPLPIPLSGDEPPPLSFRPMSPLPEPPSSGWRFFGRRKE